MNEDEDSSYEDLLAEIERLTAEIEAIGREIEAAVALQNKVSQELAALRRKKYRLEQKLIGLYPYDALRIEGNIS